MLIQYGFKYNGQTEYISELVGKEKYDEIMILSTSTMLLIKILSGFVTTHIPLKDVSEI